MVLSQRERILLALKARLEAIALDHASIEFATNVGDQVYLGEAPAFGPDDPPHAIVIAVGDDEVDFQGEAFQITLPLGIQAIVPADITAPYQAAEQVLADIKRAVELEDRSLGGLVRWHGLERGSVRTLQREPGSQFVGVEIEYRATYGEGWGAP